jgi:hypothetical protein
VSIFLRKELTLVIWLRIIGQFLVSKAVIYFDERHDEVVYAEC